MTQKNNIDELYLLITNSIDKHQIFIDNLDIWTTFYNNRFSIIKDNIINPKLFTIIKFLLEQEKGEISKHFHNDIIEEVRKSQQ